MVDGLAILPRIKGLAQKPFLRPEIRNYFLGLFFFFFGIIIMRRRNKHTSPNGPRQYWAFSDRPKVGLLHLNHNLLVIKKQ